MLEILMCGLWNFLRHEKEFSTAKNDVPRRQSEYGMLNKNQIHYIKTCLFKHHRWPIVIHIDCRRPKSSPNTWTPKSEPRHNQTQCKTSTQNLYVKSMKLNDKVVISATVNNVVFLVSRIHCSTPVSTNRPCFRNVSWAHKKLKTYNWTMFSLTNALCGMLGRLYVVDRITGMIGMWFDGPTCRCIQYNGLRCHWSIKP